jgi:hypothetical protein
MHPVLSVCEGYQLHLADYARQGLRVGIWASSGRGKSFGVGVFCEELLCAGIPVIAIDPESELHTLREQYKVIVLGGDRGDLPLPAGRQGVRAALSHALDENLALVIDLSEKPSSKSQQEAALPWLEELWILLSERRKPAALVVEEVHIFAPQSGSAVTADIMQRFAKQGRKRGAMLVAASQRTQAVSKEFMSQLNFPAIGGFETERDYEAVKAWLDGHPFDEFRALEPGHFFLAAVNEFHRWRPRLTSHGGDSPTWLPTETQSGPARDSELDALVEVLRAAFEEEQADDVDTPTVSTVDRSKIKSLEHELSATQKELTLAREEVNRLRTAMQVMGHIKVVIQQEVIARAAAIPVPVAAMQAAAAPFVAQAIPVETTVTVVKAEAATPSIVREVRLNPDLITGLPEVKNMVRRARDRARRRATKSGEWMAVAVKALAGGAAINPAEMVAKYGYYGKVTINRMEAVLDALVGVGFAVFKSGQYRLNEPYIRQLIMAQA